jgi:hypothetical protein
MRTNNKIPTQDKRTKEQSFCLFSDKISSSLVFTQDLKKFAVAVNDEASFGGVVSVGFSRSTRLLIFFEFKIGVKIYLD